VTAGADQEAFVDDKVALDPATYIGIFRRTVASEDAGLGDRHGLAVLQIHLDTTLDDELFTGRNISRKYNFRSDDQRPRSDLINSRIVGCRWARRVSARAEQISRTRRDHRRRGRGFNRNTKSINQICHIAILDPWFRREKLHGAATRPNRVWTEGTPKVLLELADDLDQGDPSSASSLTLRRDF
jgi:hypothetical protein